MTTLGMRGAQSLRRVVRRLSTYGGRMGTSQGLARRVDDARGYWTGESGERWLSDSHWRGGLDDETWHEVGQEHLAMFEMFAKGLDRQGGLGVVIEWGCGGGANGVAFAPRAEKFIAADVSADSVAECIRQVAVACDTPTEPVLIDIEHPEQAAAGFAGTCDTFLCLYVLELTAGPEEALRILRIAERLLVSGGMALIQVKYHNMDGRTRGYTRNYRRNLASMTTFAIDEFWLRAQDCGLTPRLLTLVPRNRLDSRYAYYALEKP